MSERIHMTAPDGRTFTFAQWCEYLKQHPDSVYESYRSADGKVFQVDGFRFNVHGSCRNPHVIHIAPEGDRIGGILTYINVRTFRLPYNRHDGRVVWWFDSFSINAGHNAFGRLSPEDPDDEREVIRRGLERMIEDGRRQERWLRASLRNATENEIHDTTYGGDLKRLLTMRKLIYETLEDYRQLSLF